MRKTYYEECPKCGRITTCVLYGKDSAIHNMLEKTKKRFDNGEIHCFICNSILRLVEKNKED